MRPAKEITSDRDAEMSKILVGTEPIMVSVTGPTFDRNLVNLSAQNW